jgi:uncharacterized coiled-coil DUF342 family protein
MEQPKETRQEVFKKIMARQADYQKQITELQGKIDVLKTKQAETEKELKELQDDKNTQAQTAQANEDEFDEMLNDLLKESDKVKDMFTETHAMFEVPPKQN